MILGIKGKQVAGVTAIVGLAVIVLSAMYLSSLIEVRLQESDARAKIIMNIVVHRASDAVRAAGDPVAALRADAGLRDALQYSAYAESVVYAAVVDLHDVALARDDEAAEGQVLPPQEELDALLGAGPIARIRAIYEPGGRTLDVREPLFLNGSAFGAVRVGVSTLLIRNDVGDALKPAMWAAGAALVAAVLVAMLLSQILLRPIHLIRSGLTQLGRGEFDVTVDLPHEREFTGIGESFKTVSAQLSADRTQLAGQQATLASVVEHLEEAVAIVNPAGAVVFANPAMRAAMPADPFGKPLAEVLPEGHPYRDAVERTLATGIAEAPAPARVPIPSEENGSASDERLVLTHVIADRTSGAGGRILGVMLVARNLGYLSRMQSTLDYSRKLAALSRLSAGIAHEVKNPLNATMIHLELLKEQFADAERSSREAALTLERATQAASGGGDALAGIDLHSAREHLNVIDGEMRRLDDVVQGFLRFTRPEELTLQPVSVASIVEDLVPIVKAEAEACGVTVRVECPPDLPLIAGDPALLQQAFLNLALNACQAMPAGGTLRITAARRGSRIDVLFVDTGAGIAPEHLERIFDLYFTTKAGGSGIGLSMVFRTVQLHDGEIEVQSTPGRGTTFKLSFPVTYEERQPA